MSTPRQVIREMLVGLESVKRICPERVFHGQAPQETLPPYLVFQIIARRPVKHLQGNAGLTRYLVQADVYSFKTADAEDITLDLDNLVKRMPGTQWVWNEEQTEGVEPPASLGEKGLRRATSELVVWI